MAIIQGKKSITEELFNLIKQDLRIKDIDTNIFTREEHTNQRNADISKDNADLININKTTRSEGQTDRRTE